MNLHAIITGDKAWTLRVARLRVLADREVVRSERGQMKYQAIKLLEYITKFTPPRTQRQGAAAVKTDLLRIFTVVSDDAAKEIGRRCGGSPLAQEWVPGSKGGRYRLTAAGGLKRTLAEASAWHRRSRSRTSGRTIKMRETERAVIAPGLFLAYLKQTQAKVGRAKAGWTAGTEGVGGAPPPNYIARHGKGEGRYTDARTAPRPHLEFENATTWARTRSEGQRIVDSAIANRIKTMDRELKHAMDRVAAQAKV